MKKYFVITLINALSLLLIPLIVCSAAGREKKEEIPGAVSAADEKITDMSVISVYMPGKGCSEEMNFRDYIIGVVAGEMPVVFEKDALSAQALASATLARRLISGAQGKSDDSAALTADPVRFQAYMTKEEMHERWGDDFGKYYEKLCAAVDEVIDYTITYEDKPILAVFHAISPGRTEVPENIWVGKIPYLRSVESEGDCYAPGYSSEEVFSESEFSALLSAEGVKTSGEPENFIEDSEYSPSGTLIKMKICGKKFTGNEIRKIFSLRSAAVNVKYSGGKFVFSVKGYGHGVGLSQYGADYYARQGMSWREIISHYYPDTTLV